MVSLGWCVLTTMLIASSIAHHSSNEDRILEEWIHLETEYNNLLHKISEDINGEEGLDFVKPEHENDKLEHENDKPEHEYDGHYTIYDD